MNKRLTLDKGMGCLPLSHMAKQLHKYVSLLVDNTAGMGDG